MQCAHPCWNSARILLQEALWFSSQWDIIPAAVQPCAMRSLTGEEGLAHIIYGWAVSQEGLGTIWNATDLSVEETVLLQLTWELDMCHTCWAPELLYICVQIPPFTQSATDRPSAPSITDKSQTIALTAQTPIWRSRSWKWTQNESDSLVLSQGGFVKVVVLPADIEDWC